MIGNHTLQKDFTNINIIGNVLKIFLKHMVTPLPT